MKRIGIVLHAGRPQAAATARWLVEAVGARGIQVFANEADAARIDATSVIAGRDLPGDLDIVFVLGGDGTLLRAAEMTADTAPPLLGVNFGHLGFLSELERAELEPGLQRVLDEGFEVEERMMLECVLRDAGEETTLHALNDVIVAKMDIGRAIKLSVALGGEPFVSWAADGVIVATPTGSTAYSLSVGGPVVSPRVDCITVTPVAPHALFDRTLVVPPDEDVVVRVLPDADHAALSIDGGEATPLQPGAEITVRAGARRVRLAKLEPSPFWRLVREKFDLGEGPQ